LANWVSGVGGWGRLIVNKNQLISGSSLITSSKQKIKKFWKPLFKTWFTDGIDDPRITVIKVKPDKGYYWDTKHNMVVGLLKRAAGAVMGKTLDDSIEGKLDV